MKKVLFVLGLIVGSLSVTQAQQAHVVLITVDGFRPDFYKDASWYSRLLPGFHGNRNRFRCFWKRYSEKYGRTPNGTGRHRTAYRTLT
jgi:hypothetical protein